MEVFVEEISTGTLVAGRIVLQGNRSIQEVARISMSRANWEDFIRCLGYPRHTRQGKLVFAPTTKKSATPAKLRLSDTPTPFVLEPISPALAASVT